MGRSAKLMKRQTKAQKDLAKTVSRASKPLALPPPPPPSQQQQSEGGANAGQKRRKSLRAKAEKKA